MRSMVWLAAGLATLFGLVAHDTSAQTFYQCLSTQGHPEFSEEPCIHGLPPGSGKPRGKANATSALHAQPLRADKSASRTCLQARRAFEAVSRVEGARSNDVQARRSVMQQACAIKAPPEVTIIRPPRETSPNRH